jgi:hypothetical protein
VENVEKLLQQTCVVMILTQEAAAVEQKIKMIISLARIHIKLPVIDENLVTGYYICFKLSIIRLFSPLRSVTLPLYLTQ